MTSMAVDEPRDTDTRTEPVPDADYATFLRVRNGISNEALRAAGLPPAQELTYDAYLRAFGSARRRDHGGPPPPAREVTQPSGIAREVQEEHPPAPPLGRRLILDEAPDGTWRVVAGSDRLQYMPPPPFRPVAKIVAMVMGLAFAFVAAATINAVFLHQDRWRLMADADQGHGIAAVQLEGTKDDGRPSVSETVPLTDLQIDTASGGAPVSPAESGKAVLPLPEVDVATKTAQPVPMPKTVSMPEPTPMPARTKPVDLPRSTPTAAQQRLPSSTKPASAP